MSTFAGTTIQCPHCRAADLMCCESDDSGCPVDRAYCPECGKGFQVSYKVVEVLPVPEWDIGTRAEREAKARAANLEEAKHLRAKADHLEGR